MTVNIIQDFNKILKLYAQDLAITLGTTLASDKDMKINIEAVNRGDKNFLIPSKNRNENKMLHDFEPHDDDFKLIVKSMVKFVTENH